MANEQRDQGQQQDGSREQRQPDRNRKPNQQQGGYPGDKRQQRQGDPNQQRKSADQGLAGVDTDGDGKVVQPGQRPGQSHGTGRIEE